jgi:hypothetical protein
MTREATLKKTRRLRSGSEHDSHRPRVGERRKSRRLLWIDTLPQIVKDEIVTARAERKTWKQTAQAASDKAGIALPVTTVQRWYDLRIEQPQRDASPIVPLLREIIDLLKIRLPAVTA